MPHLSDATRRKLYFLPQNGHAPHGAANLACWNWALTGFGPVQIDPAELFSYVSTGIAYGQGPYGQGANPPPLYQNQRFQQGMTALRNRWQQYEHAALESQPRLDVLHQINTELVRAAILLNGLDFEFTCTPYQMVMHYDPQSANVLNGPNYTHWWLQIDGGGADGHNDGLEAWPGSADLNIRRPEYNSVAYNCRVYIPQLHQAHVDVIDNVLTRVIEDNHPNLPHHNARWWMRRTAASALPGSTR